MVINFGADDDKDNDHDIPDVAATTLVDAANDRDDAGVVVGRHSGTIWSLTCEQMKKIHFFPLCITYLVPKLDDKSIKQMQMLLGSQRGASYV